VSNSTRPEKLYELAGIDDLAEFYRTRYVSNQLLDAQYFHALNRFDISWSRTMWIYDNVRSGSSVLDLGCGAGVLALLRRKAVRLTGVDLSEACAETARGNGYDDARVGNLTRLPFADASFDYVVSLDVMGHVEFHEKDAVLGEIRRVLKPDGVTLHGIETMNREQQKDYHEMSADELRRFVQVDGHVGMEPLPAVMTRFSRFFAHVAAAPRYRICQPADVLTKLSDEYGMQSCDVDFLDYVRGLSFDERRAFNMAMGYVFDRISEFAMDLPASGYAYVKASAAPLGLLYREHYDHSGLFPQPIDLLTGQTVSLNESTAAAFDGGWYEAENFPPVGRWMGSRAKVSFVATRAAKIWFELITHVPDVQERPLQLEFLVNGEPVHELKLARTDWQKIELEIAGGANDQTAAYDLEIRADRTWRPSSTNAASTDDRELSIAVANLRVSG